MAMAYVPRLPEPDTTSFVTFELSDRTLVTKEGLVLAGMGLHLGMEVPNWPPENLEYDE